MKLTEKPQKYWCLASTPKLMTLAEAHKIAHSLGDASKMPGKTYGLPAKECGVGGRLRNVENSVCFGCYALKGRYIMENVQTAEYIRLDSITHPLWVDAMSVQINHYCKRVPFFRWHDSGDLQSLEHLQRIVEVVKLTPSVKHWLPTREYKIVKLYRDLYGAFPSNLVVRLSGHMIDEPPPSGYGLPTSTVVSDHSETCPSRQQGNECGDCRDCWDLDVINVSYAKH